MMERADFRSLPIFLNLLMVVRDGFVPNHFGFKFIFDLNKLNSNKISKLVVFELDSAVLIDLFFSNDSSSWHYFVFELEFVSTVV